VNLGVDADVTPRFRVINNLNFLGFDQTESLETLIFQSDVDSFIGVDLSFGAEYRPILHNNVIIVGGLAVLFPGDGFRDLYDPLRDNANAQAQAFVDVAVTY
jgi:hypothetical protein